MKKSKPKKIRFTYISEPDNENDLIDDIDSGIQTSNMGSRYGENFPNDHRTLETPLKQTYSSFEPENPKKKKLAKTASLANV